MNAALPDCETAVKISGKRFGIEAMFKDCKTGGYNLEGSQASSDRLVRLVLLIALAMSTAWLQGQHTSTGGQSSYICRPKETRRTRRRHSNFWIGFAVSSAERFVWTQLDRCFLPVSGMGGTTPGSYSQ